MGFKQYGKCCGTCKHGMDYDYSGIRGSWYCKKKKEVRSEGNLCKRYQVDVYYKNRIVELDDIKTEEEI